MKKERIVVLCVCAVLLGSLYAQWIAWACHFVMPSMALAVSPAPRGALFSPVSSVEFVSAGWPPLGFIYGNLCRMYGDPGEMNARRENVQHATWYVTKRTLPSGRK